MGACASGGPVSTGRGERRFGGSLQHHHIRQVLSCYMVHYAFGQTDWVNSYTRTDHGKKQDEEKGSHFPVPVASQINKLCHSSGAFPETRSDAAIKLRAFIGRMLPSGNPVISIHPWPYGGVCVCVYKSFPSRERPSVHCVLNSFLQKRWTRPAVRPHLRCLLAYKSSYSAKSTVTGKDNSLRSARTFCFA